MAVFARPRFFAVLIALLLFPVIMVHGEAKANSEAQANSESWLASFFGKLEPFSWGPPSVQQVVDSKGPPSVQQATTTSASSEFYTVVDLVALFDFSLTTPCRAALQQDALSRTRSGLGMAAAVAIKVGLKSASIANSSKSRRPTRYDRNPKGRFTIKNRRPRRGRCVEPMLRPEEVEDAPLPAELEQVCGADIAEFEESYPEEIGTVMCDFASATDFAPAFATALTERLSSSTSSADDEDGATRSSTVVDLAAAFDRSLTSTCRATLEQDAVSRTRSIYAVTK